MRYIKRLLKVQAHQAIARGKSLLILGPRQTGKTSFIRTELHPDVEISFVKKSTRLRYEKNPELLEYELEDLIKKTSQKPLIFIDEVQKVPAIMDTLQYLIDKKLAVFIISGSSARKLKHGKDINLLPGRVVSYTMYPFLYQEIEGEDVSLEDMLLYGSLPAIVLEPDYANKETDISSYVTTYLEEEIRAEAVVRDMGRFAQFLQLAAGESGKHINYTQLSQDVGVAASTIAGYFQVLVDCLVAIKIEPITTSVTKRRLIKSARYLFFDLGIRRICANEGAKLPVKVLGDLFEQFVGLQLNACASFKNPQVKLRYWRDSAGPEIDYVLEFHKSYIPIEVKSTAQPVFKDTRHLEKFLEEYENATFAYIVCQTPRPYILGKNKNIRVISWKDIPSIFDPVMV